MTASTREGITPSVIYNIISFEDINLWNENKDFILEDLDISFKILKEEEKILTLLFYKKSLLEKKLNNKRIQKFLIHIGYPKDVSLEEYLNHLSKRYNVYDFPHEIGLFLGYPLKDVYGFIENKGKNYIACKYWKVYHNKNHALRVFDEIDKAKENAMRTLTLALI
ncbi:DUF3793 family protein [Anaeropeptidivorans aminofermentans]|uniref:DUF3793 family protein n=1 Tax=Anaeropeptidivorans aminofermentans TaxID=2934315 RepID=UPI002B2028C3|nr:DUF3793 family protein [Anaeropeptidivorans aminofermentans]